MLCVRVWANKRAALLDPQATDRMWKVLLGKSEDYSPPAHVQRLQKVVVESAPILRTVEFTFTPFRDEAKKASRGGSASAAFQNFGCWCSASRGR